MDKLYTKVQTNLLIDTSRSRLNSISPHLVVGAAVLLMLALKAALLIGERVPFNSDEAVVALMARHILGGARPVFFYGQAYMGSLDAWLVAGGFAIFGQQVWVIRLVQALLYAGVLLTTARLGREILHSAWAGALAALLLAIPTVNVTLYTTASLGGYGEALLIGNLILLTSLSLRHHIEQGHPALGVWLGWGFLVGLGLWAFGLTLIYSLPAGIYLLVWLQRGLRKQSMRWRGLAVALIAALVGFCLGAAPWLAYAAQNGFSALLAELGGGAIAGVEQLPWLLKVFQHTVNLFLLGFTVTFGLRPPWSVDWLAWPLLPLALIFWMLVVAWMLVEVRRRDVARPERLMLAGVGMTLVLTFIFTPFGADPSGRYFTPLAIPLALFGGALLEKVGERKAWLAPMLLGLALAFNLWGTVQCALRYPPGITTQFYAPTQVDHRYDEALIDFLQAHGKTRGYTNYWVAYPLAFLSNEELIFVPHLPYHTDLRYTARDDRYPPYTAQVAAAPRTAYITTHNPTLDDVLRAGFTSLGVTWQEEKIGDYQIYYALSRPVHPAELGLGKQYPP
jgi:4-amino-4-deoxy-L-arabinose transferase-like glycosyltransferase